MPSSSKSNVRSLSQWKNREAASLLSYLCARLEAGDLPGLVVQSLDGCGRERVHLTGTYKASPERALGAALSLSIRMTQAAGAFEDSSF